MTRTDNLLTITSNIDTTQARAAITQLQSVGWDGLTPVQRTNIAIGVIRLLVNISLLATSQLQDGGV